MKTISSVNPNSPLIKMEQSRQDSGITLLDRKTFIDVLTVLFILADSLTLYTLMSKVLTQVPALSLVITGTISAILNISPSMAAKVIRGNMATAKKTVALFAIGVLFTSLFVGSFVLRWELRDQLTGIIGLSITSSYASSAERAIPAGTNIAAILMGLEPLGTSLTLFVLAMLSPAKAAVIRETRIQRLAVQRLIAQRKAELSEIQEELNYDLEGHIKAKKDITDRLVMLRTQYWDAICARKLAEKLGTADAISRAMEEEAVIKNQMEMLMKSYKEVA